MFDLAPTWLPAFALLLSAPRPLPQESTPSVDEQMVALLEQYGTKEKKYEALLKKIEKEVTRTLASSPWREAQGDRPAQPLADHPWLQLVAELTEGSHASAKAAKKNSELTKELLTTFPWSEELELVLGLEYGSDRPVPDNENGFINLGEGPDSLPGFPDYVPNQYLFGLCEVVGSQYRVRSKKDFRFEGRGPKDGPERDTELPAWEAIRVYLQGSLPDVPLFAIPELTHRIHSRLLQRRQAEDGSRAPMDRVLALLDSRWNGFYFEVPYSKDRVALVRPAHALFTDDKGFVSNFKESQHLAEVGDLPFLSILTHMLYAQEFHGVELSSGDIIRESEAARPILERFQQDCVYLARYKSLIDEIVRAALAPHLPYPTYLEIYDFVGGAPPTERESGPHLDKPRAHAILLWAYAGGDPAAVADFLHDFVLSQEANRFPGSVSLPNATTVVVREKQDEMLAALAERLAGLRSDGPSEQERQFSPNAEFLSATGETRTDYVAHSFTQYHLPLAEAIRSAARNVVAEELD